MQLNTKFRVVSLCTDPRVDRRILDGARTLTENGWPTLVIAPPAPGGDTRDESSYPDVAIYRMPGSFVPAGMLPEMPLEISAAERLFPWQRRLTLAALAFPSEVVIANDLPQLGAGVLAAHAHGSTLIYDAHELYPQQIFLRAQAPQLTAIEARLIPHAHGVVTVNDSIADVLAMSYGCPRPHVVLNCPSRRHYDGVPHDDGRLRHAAGLPADRRILLYQGGMVQHRSLMELVEGMAHLRTPDVSLVMMGPRGTYGDELEARASALGLLGKRVHFVPEVPASELLHWTIGADAGIIPYPHCDMNTLMCTPNKLFEFLVAGLPILATHGVELRRFVGDQGVGMNAVMRTAEDVGLAVDAFFAGPLASWRTRVAELSARYTWEHEGQLWLDIVPAAVREHQRRTTLPLQTAA
ncbi:MAG: glycosyltransferase [Gemmatimonadota bacterium]